MNHLKRLTSVAVAAIVVFATGCSRPAQEPTGQAAGSPATQAADTPSAARPAAAPPPGTAQPAAAPLTPAEPPKPRTFTLEAGTVVQVQTTSSLSTKTNKAGEPITGTLVAPIVDGEWVIATKGAPVSGVIVSSDPGGRVKGVASMAIGMKKLTLANGETVGIATSAYGVEAKSSTKKDAVKVAVGAGAGAVIGGIAGGGKGAGIGAGAGAGAGTAAVLATHGDPAVIPAGTVVNFKLTEPITVTKKQ